MTPDVAAAVRDRLLFANPWHEAPGVFAREVARFVPAAPIARSALPIVATPRKAALVVGPRQAGKSTWIWQQLASRDPRTVLYLNCEEPLFRELCASPLAFLQQVGAWLPEVRVLFLEEAQHLPEAGLFIKGIVDAKRGFEVWVTGSSAYDLAAKTRESLAGRAQRRRILPLSLGEQVGASASLPPAVRARAAEAALRKHWVWGGYPAVVTAARPAEELRELLEAFVIRDASDRFRIQRPDAFRRLIALAAGQVGSLVNLAEWASILGVAASTVNDYLALLEESWVLRRLPAFAGGKRSEITSAQRIFFVDPGLRNAALGAFSEDLELRPDRGALAESFVFAELLKALPEAWTIHYWRTKGGAEIDFVLVSGDRRIGVEVKHGGRAALSRSTRSFIEAYAPEAVIQPAQSGTLGAAATREGATRVLFPRFEALADTVRAIVDEGG
jgi:predicted AAA+ superfamily ATPase